MTGEDRVNPFVAAVVATLREMAGVEAVPRGAVRPPGPDEFGDLSAVLRLSAEGEGYLVLSFPTETATALAVRILGGAAEADAGMVRDCAGELANVVAGQAKALLSGTPDHFTFSTPWVDAGRPAVPAGDWDAVGFASDVGEFLLRVRPPG